MPEKIFIADKETLDSVKADTSSIKTTAEAILQELSGARPKRYGYRVKIDESNPETRVEYLFDAVGMTPAKMDFAAGTFNYGSWADLWFIRDNYPCMVKSDGSEAPPWRFPPSPRTRWWPRSGIGRSPGRS